MATTIDLLDTTSHAPGRRTSKSAAMLQRGLTTAEYCVGILAAVTVVLTVIRIFNDNAFFSAVSQLIIKVLHTATGRVG